MIGQVKFSQQARLTLAGILLSAGTGLGALLGCGGSSSNVSSSGLPNGKATLAQVQQGQSVVTSYGCVDCHSQGKNDPSSPTWMAGYLSISGTSGPGTFAIGPWQVYAPNLTPDATGLGPVTDRQVYNALKFGLDPTETPDVIITSTTPGQGNFPTTPHYLAPPMPWASTRHLSDSNLWAVVAYLHHGIKAVSNTVPSTGGPGGGPADFWASNYTSDKIGPTDIPAYPSGNEQFSP